MGGSPSTSNNTGPNITGGQGDGHIIANIGNVTITKSSPRAAPSLSTVMNCGENPLRIYLHEQELDTSTITYEQDSTMYFKQDSEIPFIVVPAKASESFGGSPAFASVFVQCSTDSEVVKATIYVSVAIPSGRSFIVTPNHEIKLQKQGSDNKWLDEDGVDHTPK